MRDTTITGVCYPPNSSNKANAQLIVHQTQQFELIIGREIVQTGNLHDLKFSDRIGTTNRKIYFANGNQFETSDNDTIDQLLKSARHKNSNTTIISKAESSWTFALVSVFITVLAVAGFFKFGLPFAALHAANKIPVSTAEKLSEEALVLIDRIAAKPTKLTNKVTNGITQRFNERLSALPDKGDFVYKLHFRQMGGMANAFALPGGDIVVTDALAMLTNESELDSILLHEIAHVVKRHGLQAVIKASAMSVIVTIALGDLSTVAELTTGIATFYIQSNYSREAEAEADDFALIHLANQNLDPIHFANAMQKLESQFNPEFDKNAEETKSYLSTHPSSLSRIRKAEEQSRLFNAN